MINAQNSLEEKKMLLSIITVVKNNHNGLLKTYNSISSQKIRLHDKIEWIVIDGGGDAEKLLSEINPVFDYRYIIESDDGIFDAMNKGVKLANGKYLLFLNAGDVFYDDNVLSVFVPHLSLENNFIIAGSVNMLWGDISVYADLKPWVCHQAAFIPSNILNLYVYDKALRFFGDLNLWKYLHSKNKFYVKRIDSAVAKFSLGGVGNSPKFIIKRTIERIKIGCRYNEGLYLVPFRVCYGLLLYFIWTLLGEKGYYKFILRKYK